MKDNGILKHLKMFPSSRIYLLTNKNFLQEGYKYYQERRLTKFDWNSDFSTLIAKVKDFKTFSVKFSISNDKLNYKCNCSSSIGTYCCKHIICSLFGIKNIFSPQVFKIHNDPLYRKLLASTLFQEDQNEQPENKVQNKKGYSIIIDDTNKSFYYYVKKDYEKVSTFSKNCPTNLKKLTQWQDSHFFSGSPKIFLNYLKKNKNVYPLYLEINKNLIPLKWDDLSDFDCKTEINVINNIVYLKKLCFRENQQINTIRFIGNIFAADVGAGTLFSLGNQKGWLLWEYFYQKAITLDIENELSQTNTSTLINIPLNIFQKLQFIFKEEEKVSLFQNIIFKVNNKISPPITVKHSYSLTLKPIIDKFILKTECIFPKNKHAPTRAVFDIFNKLDRSIFFSKHLKTKKRKAAIYDLLINLLSHTDKTSTDDLINNFTSENILFDHTDIETNEYLTKYFNMILSSEERLQFSGNDWFSIKIDKKKEGVMYKIPYKLFGWEIFDNAANFDEMEIPSNELLKKLSILYKMCKDSWIKLFLEDKPIAERTWDFSFDASGISKSNFLEIKPEIRDNNKLISHEDLQKAFKNKGIIEKTDCIEILDNNSQKILNRIQNTILTNKDKTEEKKEIIKVPALAILDWVSLRSQGVKINLNPKDNQIVDQLINFEKINKKSIPKKLKAKLRTYQKTGYYWLSFLYEHKFGACLADDMGLGKTIQAITLMGGIKEKIVKAPTEKILDPHLIVTPTSILFNWESEIKKFYPSLSIYLFTGKDRSFNFKKADIVLTTYGIIRRDINKLRENNFHLIIFDEAQAIKNIYADTTGAARLLKAYFKVALTGTPIENHLGEYFSILDLCLPGLLGDHNKFNKLIKKDNSPVIDIIIKRTGPFVLRRTKKKILKELPKKIETDIYLDLNAHQKTLYNKTVELVKTKIDDAYNNKTKSQAQIIALTALLKLRQICLSPNLLIPNISEPSPKIKFLLNKLTELLDENHSALVFSQFTSFLDILEKELKVNNFEFSRLDGSISGTKRKSLVENFQKSKKPSIFLLSLRAGGQGLNLTKASYVFHLDPWWNPAVENQASDRAHRIGQKNKVSIMRILMRHTIEEKMMKLKEKKYSLYKAVLEDSSSSKKGFHISKSDFDFLLK